MLDFVSIKCQNTKQGTIISPEFRVKRSKDLMIRGKSFYAIWDEERGFWSRNETDVQRLIDQMLLDYVGERGYEGVSVKYLSDFSNKKWLEWQNYAHSLPDHYHELDKGVTFYCNRTTRDQYSSRCLPYQLERKEIPAYEELISTLYDSSERQKIEWAIGSIIAGDSKKIQKFLVFYGDPGTGKSTVLNLVDLLFQGYVTSFEAKTLTQNGNGFALEPFREDPLVGIDHEAELSRIDDNTRLNNIVSHEKMRVNEKFKSTYELQFHTFLMMGTNKPVMITDSKSGLLRRLIDVSPTGSLIPRARYDEILDQLPFELGGIAQHCLDVYHSLGRKYYDTYKPVQMLSITNDFYNFMEDNLDFFLENEDEGVPLKMAWTRYRSYCEEANIPYPLRMRLFKSELKNYFEVYVEREYNRRNIYRGLKLDKFESEVTNVVSESSKPKETSWIKMEEQESLFDTWFRDCPAQYSTSEGIPSCSWSKCKTVLGDLDSRKEHYVRPPESLIVIDFDLRDEVGNKDLERNLEAASKWPKTYAELSKSGGGIHLHYTYKGDAERLSRIYDENIEIKIFTKKSSLRRKLTLCNDLEISVLSSGLPFKEEKCMLREETIKSEQALRTLIERNLRKEIHPNTKPSVDFIKKILDS